MLQSDLELYNLSLNMSAGEANAMAQRYTGHGCLAWKKLTSVLNPWTLASWIKAISSSLSPNKIVRATKADQEIEEWEDRTAKLRTQYGQELTAKMNVAVLYAMLPKDLQEGVLDECVVNWDETPEQKAGELWTRIKNHSKNIAKACREVSGSTPMEVEAVSDGEAWNGWGSWKSSVGTTGASRGMARTRRTARGATSSSSARAVRREDKASKAIAQFAASSGTRSGNAPRRTGAKRTVRAVSRARASGVRPTERGTARTIGTGRA